jgi:hypothetical protein
METIELQAIKERVIEVNYYMLEALMSNDERKVQKLRIELDSLIKLYFKK